MDEVREPLASACCGSDAHHSCQGREIPGDIFEIADSLLLDEDDLVRKGYGWMLKEASIKHQKEVFEYVLRNNKTMPRAALRYAIERMPGDLRQRAMGKTGKTKQ